jgi:lipopolysaccharide export system protein LptA
MSTEHGYRVKKNNGGQWLGAFVLAGRICLAAAVFAAFGAGRPANSEEGAPSSKSPVRIQSEHLVADMNANTAEFSDQVRLVDDAYTLTANILTFHFKPQAEGQSRMQSAVSAKDISRMVARGRVVIRTESLTASAEVAEYEPDNGRITLSADESTAQRTAAAKTPPGDFTSAGRPAAPAEASPGRVRVTVLPPPDRR